MDARLTRIQQRYLLSERASNCSSSNTPEVKLEQRRRRKLRRGETGGKGEGGGKGGVKEGVRGGGGGGGRKEEVGEGAREGGRGWGRGARRGRGRVGRRLVVDEGMSGVTEEVERLVLTVREGEKGDGGEGGAKEEEGAKQPGESVLKETEVASNRPADPTTPNRASTLSTGIRLNKSPVVKLHKVETPPSTSRPATLFSTLISRDSTSSTTTREQHCQTGSEQEQPRTEGMETDPASPMENKSLLELVPAATSDRPATNDILDTIDQLHHTGDQLHTREGGPTSGVCGSQPGLHRSPRNRIEITLKKEPLAGTPSRAAEQTSSQQMSFSAGGLTLPQSGDVMFPETSGLRRSPRKNKWISGQGKSSFSSRHQSASDRGKTNKKVTCVPFECIASTVEPRHTQKL